MATDRQGSAGFKANTPGSKYKCQRSFLAGPVPALLVHRMSALKKRVRIAMASSSSTSIPPPLPPRQPQQGDPAPGGATAPPREPHPSPPTVLEPDTLGLTGEPIYTRDYQPPPQRNGTVEQAQQAIYAPPLPYVRDGQRLIGYLVPFPKPDAADPHIPQRFLIYTPPPPPFSEKPDSGSLRKEGMTHFCRRKWLEELREAKTRQPKPKKKGVPKVTVWKRAKWKATKGTDWGIDKTKSSNLEFLNRIARLQDDADDVAEDCYRKTISPEEIVLLHPPSFGGLVDGSREKYLKEEFIASLVRTKKKAQRDSIIAACLFPPAIVVDTLAVPVWPFGGLAEIDAVWLYASFRGAKTSRNITNRLLLPPSGDVEDEKKNSIPQLKLTFAASHRVDVLERYLAAKCHERDGKLFPEYVPSPGEGEVLNAMGWEHTLEPEGEKMSWEDRQWELQQAKDDLSRTFTKGAREWAKWCKLWQKDAEKAIKK